MKRRLGLQRCVFFGVAMVASILVHAYQFTTCSAGNVKWPNANTTMKMHTASFPAGLRLDQTVQRAMQSWTEVAGSKFVFNIGRDSSAISSTNNINQVYIANHATNPGYLAVARMRWVCGGFIGAVMSEVDVEFASVPSATVLSNRIAWLTSTDFNNDIMNNISIGIFSIEGVALHEFGHVMGLQHENRWVSTMNSFYPNAGPVGDIARRWLPHGDDRVGVRVLYPDTTTETDVAMVGFKANPNVAGASIPVAVTPSVVSRGSQVTMDFVFNNMGTSRATVNNGFYLSTNRDISYSDPWIAYEVGAWSDPGTTWYSISMTIPTWIAPGNYYLGAIIDYDNLITERYDGSNENGQNAATLLTIR